VDWVGSDGSSTFSQAQEQAAALKSNWDGAQRQDSEPEASGRRKTGPGTPVRSAPAVPAAQPGWVRARRLPLCGGTGPKRSGQAGLGSRLSHGLARPSHDGMGWPRSSLCKSPMRHVLRGVGAGTGRVCLTGLGLLMSSTRLADDADRRGRFFTTKDEALRCWQMQGGRLSRSDTADPSERPRARSARSRGEPRGNRKEGKGRMMGGWGRALHARCRPGREKGREAEAAEGIPAPFAGPAR
jgi:hypothetical protein